MHFSWGAAGWSSPVHREVRGSGSRNDSFGGGFAARPYGLPSAGPAALKNAKPASSPAAIATTPHHIRRGRGLVGYAARWVLSTRCSLRGYQPNALICSPVGRPRFTSSTMALTERLATRQPAMAIANAAAARMRNAMNRRLRTVKEVGTRTPEVELQRHLKMRRRSRSHHSAPASSKER